MRQLSIKTVFCLLLMQMMLAACVTSPPPRLDSKFGGALEMAKAQQTVNPDASLNTEAVEGVDGIAGNAAFDSYRESFITPPAQTRGGVTFGTGGTSTSSSVSGQ